MTAPGDPPRRIRAFVALVPDAEAEARLSSWVERLRPCAPDAAWTSREKLHLTLKFIARLPEPLVGPLGDIVGRVGRSAAPPCTGALRLDAFPHARHARIVVAAVEDPQHEVARMAREIERAASELGIEAEARPFRAHVTLARLKRVCDVRPWSARVDPPADAWRWAGLRLVRSELGPQGSRYVPLVSSDWHADVTSGA